jgi:DMSO reductase anchor subunit
MAQLKDKVQNALDEARMLMLGAQILVGFDYRSVFEPGFTRLPPHAQYLKLVSLGVMLIGVALIMWPSAYHQLVERGEDTDELHRFTSFVMCGALLPFAFSFGLDVFVAVERVQGHTPGLVVGSGTVALALFFWYGWELWQRRRRAADIRSEQMADDRQEQQDGATKIAAKIKHVLTEARTVLPGAQALLGFAFISMFADAFERLPASSKTVHLVSLALVALSIIMLMTPAAYHRIVEEGEETEHFHRFASRILLASMIPLALGITGDFYVVLRKVTNHTLLSAAIAALLLVAFYALWFGYTLYLRQRHTPHGTRTAAAD